MKMSDKGIVALIGHEGIVPGPYYDSKGVLTYGVGHTASAGAPDPEDLPRGMPGNFDAALRDILQLFKRDVAKYEAGVLRAVKVPMAQHEFDALVSFHFNTGGIAKAQITRHLNAGDRKKAAEAFMGWIKPAEIIDRRKEERRLFAEGIYPSRPLTVWNVTLDRRVVWKAARTLKPAEALALMQDGKTETKPSLGVPVGITAALAALAAMLSQCTGG